MSKRKRKYLDDFVANDEGGYEYQGKLWKWRPPEARADFVRQAAALLAGAGACLVAAGFVPASATGNAFYVLLPYALVLGVVGYSASCVWRINRAGDELRNHVYEKTVLALPTWLLVGCIAGTASAVGEVLHMLLASSLSPWAVAYVALLLGAAACLARLRRRASSLNLIES